MKRIVQWLVLLAVSSSLWGQGIQSVRWNVYGQQVRDVINYNDSLFATIVHPDDSTLINVKYIDVALENGWSFQEGRVGWDTEAKTLAAGLDAGSVLQIGQEVHIRATNKTGATITNGQAVYVNGAQGSRPTIALSDNDSPLAFNTIGLATQDIDHNATGYVTTIGLVRGLNTASYSEGDVLWVDSIAGGWTSTRPEAPKSAVVIGVVVVSNADNGIIGVEVTTVPRLDFLSNVSARGSQVGWDMLRWDADSTKWKPTNGTLNLPSLPTYADNAAALSGGLVAGDLYKTATGQVMIVYSP